MDSRLLTSRDRLNLGQGLVLLTTILTIFGIITLIFSLSVDHELHDYLIRSASKYRSFSRFLITAASFTLGLNAFGAKMMLDLSRPRTQSRWLFLSTPWCIATTVIVFLKLIAGLLALITAANVTRIVQRGMRHAMELYAVNVQVKAFVDELQISHECCGNESYGDWFNTQWVDLKYAEYAMQLTSNGFTDSVPFSCCNPDVFHPCIHYQVTQTAKHSPLAEKLSIYKLGCGHLIARYLEQILKAFGVSFLIAAFFQLLVLILARYLCTSASAANIAGEPESASMGYVFRGYRSNWFCKDQNYSEGSRPSSRATGGTSDSLNACSTLFSTTSTEAHQSPCNVKERLRSGHENFVHNVPSHPIPSLRPVLPCRLRPNLSPLL